MGVLDKVLKAVFGDKHQKDIQRLLPIVTQINEEFEKLKDLSNDELRAKTWQLRSLIQERIKDTQAQIDQLKQKAEDDNTPLEEKERLYKEIEKLEKKVDDIIEKTLDEILPVAFAIVKETARRFKENDELVVTATDFDRQLAAHKEKDYVVIDGDKAIYKNEWNAGGQKIKWDMVHFDVQLMGGIVLHQGKIAEMATGEGKTLVATLPLFLNALPGRGVHLVTVNDYLAKRDQEWMGPLYEFHGLSVDCIDKHEPHSEGRRKAYEADITYGTNNEFGFDYLRDNMVIDPEEMVQRGHNYAIIDEVDSVLIDEARTPLIISGPVGKSRDEELYRELKPKVVKLYEAQKRLVTQILAQAKKLYKEEKYDEAGLLLLRAYKGLPKSRPLIKFLSEKGVKALLQKTENFYLQENARRMPEVTEELYFVIDEKLNSVELTDKGIQLITEASEDPHLFVLPDLGTEIAKIENNPELSPKKKQELKEKLMQEFAEKSEKLHVIHNLLKAYAMFERDVDYVVMDGQVKIVDEHTGRILEGRRYSEGLHQAIEAKENVKIEATTQTYATVTLQNYFRMYKKLAGMTGTAETEAQEFWDIYKLEVVVIPTNKPVIREDKDDLVFRTKREKYKAIIEEVERLIKQGRAVLVGTTSVEVSEQLSRMLKRRGIKHQVLNAKHHAREAEIIAKAGQPGAVTIATNMAGRGTDIKLHPKVREAGGLAIIGSERHESRRIDRQLRGRSGRQGDPGSSQFFVSLEDDLLRLFGSERIARVMDMLNLKEGEVIQHPMITNSIERAQKKVEENNYGIRKRLLEYDDVMNVQREIIYKRRRHAVFGERLDIEISRMIQELVEFTVELFQEQADYEGFKYEMYKLFQIEPNVTEDEFLKLDAKEISERVYKEVIDRFQRKMEAIREKVWPFIKDLYEKEAHQYKYIVVPVSDGRRIFNIRTNLEQAYKTEGRQLVKDIEKTVMLVAIDEAWKEHLRELDALKEAVHTASYEQKDPLVIYKIEAYDLFKQMLERSNREVVSTLLRAELYEPKTTQQARTKQRSRFNFQQLNFQKDDAGQAGKKEAKKGGGTVVKKKKIGRNDPCPCGSGKKYKHCHGRFENSEF